MNKSNKITREDDITSHNQLFEIKNEKIFLHTRSREVKSILHAFPVSYHE